MVQGFQPLITTLHHQTNLSHDAIKGAFAATKNAIWLLVGLGYTQYHIYISVYFKQLDRN